MNLVHPLPGKKINLEGTNYFIHGLVHGTPLVYISKDFKKTIENKFKEYDVICEDGFKAWIKNAKSFNEISHFNLGNISFFEMLKSFLVITYIKLVRKNKPLLIKQIQEMKTLEDFYFIREKLFEKYFLEPQGMNYYLSKLEKGSLKKPKGEFPLLIKRYIYEAKESLKYAKAKNLDELHIVVGCAHELPLEYFLRNPNLLKRFIV